MSELQSTFAQYALFAWLLLLALILLALSWLSTLRRQFGMMSRRYATLAKGVDGVSLLDALDQHLDEIGRLRQDVAEVATRCRALDEGLQLSLRRVGVIRFNPFGNTGGDQSFALALLDDHGDGVVLSSIFGRNESRLYAKPVKGGRSKYTLTAEEEQAICQASLVR